jgi:hypothetical protein
MAVLPVLLTDASSTLLFPNAGLPQHADRLWVYEHFARFGAISSLRVMFDETTGLCCGSG